MVIKTKNPGYLYVFYNKVYNYYGKNVYKLGTTVNTKQRYGMLNTSFLDISEFKFISYKFPCKYTAESEIFQLLDEYRINRFKEFFDVELDVIIKAIESMEIKNGLSGKRPTHKHKTAENFITQKYADRNTIVYFKKPITKNGDKYAVKIDGVVVCYASDNYDKKRFMSSKKYKYAVSTGNWEIKE